MKIKIFAAFIALALAVLFQAVNVSAAFATNEVGISAYVNVGTNISLDQVASTYKIIEDRTSTYIIGIVEVPNANAYEQPHVYTSSDGWIMAYYAKEKPRALIMPWGQFDKNNPDTSLMSNTRLEEALSEVSTVVGMSYSSIKPNTKYYDFQYPSANGLTLISESRPDPGVNSFRFRVPSEYLLYDASWEYYSYDGCNGVVGAGYCGPLRSNFQLDGNQLSGTDGVISHNSISDGGSPKDERYFGTISALTKDVLHKGDLVYNPISTDVGSSSIAIVLIYKRP